jgi:hypothetical protein
MRNFLIRESHNLNMGDKKMKNIECTIYITTKHGKTQSYRKGKKGWTQTSSNGIVRPLTAEQLLSHILPPLAIGHLSVRVEPDNKGIKNSEKSYGETKKK